MAHKGDWVHVHPILTLGIILKTVLYSCDFTKEESRVYSEILFQLTFSDIFLAHIFKQSAYQVLRKV